MRWFRIAMIMLGLALSLTTPASVVDGEGWLVISGGDSPPGLAERFVTLAGGQGARVVVIPTAAGFETYDKDFEDQYFAVFREHGVSDIRLLHTDDRAEADEPGFSAPIDQATGVWFTGGRQGLLGKVYVGTETETALHRLLQRGGVIGGGSAGASIQASTLIRGDIRGNMIVLGGYEKGFGFLPDTAIDQHLLRRNRQFDLVEVIRDHPHLLGIGLGGDAFIVVHHGELEVGGSAPVAIYDPALIALNGRFYFLQPGDRFDLHTRVATRNGGRLLLDQLYPVLDLSKEELARYEGRYESNDGASIRVTSDGTRLTIKFAGTTTTLIPISQTHFYGADAGMNADFSFKGDSVTSVRWRAHKVEIFARRTK